MQLDAVITKLKMLGTSYFVLDVYEIGQFNSTYEASLLQARDLSKFISSYLEFFLLEKNLIPSFHPPSCEPAAIHL